MSTSSLLQNRWTDPSSFIEKSSWVDLCTPLVIADQVATREELEHAIRMAFAESIDPFAPNATSQTKTNYAQQLKFSRAFVASLALSENIPRIAPLVFEGLESAVEDASNVELRMMQMIRKKNSSLLNSRQQWVGAARFPIATLSMIAWLRISKTIVVEEEEAAQQQHQRTLLGIISSSSTLGTTSNGMSLANKWPPISVAGAKRFLARVLPLSFIPTFVFASTSSTIPGLLATITSMANEAGSGFLSTVDPMSRCALICVAASGDGVETAIVSELTTADVQGEKSFFRTPLSYPCSSETQPAQQNDVFSIAHWFNTSDAAAPFSVSQMHHPFLVYALRRSLCRMEISAPAAAKWLQYCEVVVRDVEGFASKILGRGTTRSMHWLSSGTKGVGIRFWDALLRECALMCEAAVVHMTKPESQLSTLLWMLVSHASQGVRASLSLREYDPLLEIRDTDGSSAANLILLAPPMMNGNKNNIHSNNQKNNNNNNNSGPPRPFVCSPEQLFVLCRAALRCDISLTRQEKQKRAADFMADVCTEEILVSLSLDPSQCACTLVALLRFACEFNAPLEPHLHLVFSVVALSPLIGATILGDHLKFIYKSLSSVGRVELLLRILFLPITCAALEVQMALSDSPPDDFADASFCLFHLWRCIAPLNATSRARSMSLYTIFRACFGLAFNSDSEFKLMWECCMLDDLCLMGERERAASVCVKDSLLDGFFECVAENNMMGRRNGNGNNNSSHHENAWIEEEGILHASTFMFRFGVFPRMHCAEILKRIVLHVRVLLGTSSTSSTIMNSNNNNNNKSSGNENGENNNTNNNNNGQVLSLVSDGNNNNNHNNNDENSTSSSSSASTLLQFLCGFGSSNSGVLHDDFDRYSDAFFDAIANVLVIAGKYAASQGERSASRVFQSIQDLAWECLTSFKTSTVMITNATPTTSPTFITSTNNANNNPSASILSGHSSNSLQQHQQRQLQAQANRLNVNQMLLGAHNTFSSPVDVPRRGLPTSSSSLPPTINTTASMLSNSQNQNQNNNSSTALQVFTTTGVSTISSSSNEVTPNATTRLSSPPESGGGRTTTTTTTTNNQQPAKTTGATLRSFFSGFTNSSANINLESPTSVSLQLGNNNSNSNANNSNSNSNGTAAVTTSTAYFLTANSQNISDKNTKVPAYDQHGDLDFLNYSLDDSVNVMGLQPTVNFVAFRVVGLKSLPSIQERMLKRLEAIAISLAHVTARHVSLRERAVMWLRACWKAAENWLNSYHQSQQMQQQQQNFGGSRNYNSNNNNANAKNNVVFSMILKSSLSSQSMIQENSNNYSSGSSTNNTQSQIQNLFTTINNEDAKNISNTSKNNKKKNNRRQKSSSSPSSSSPPTTIELFTPTMMAMLLGNNSSNQINRDDEGNSRKNMAGELLRERCEQLCITCSSLCNLLLHHTDVLIASGGGSAAGSM